MNVANFVIKLKYLKAPDFSRLSLQVRLALNLIDPAENLFYAVKITLWLVPLQKTQIIFSVPTKWLCLPNTYV